MNTKIIDVDLDNITQYPATCFMSPKTEGYQIKRDWLGKRFSEGLKIKLLYLENDKKCHGYIEYVPGEYAWRAVDAKGYLFIHCLWTYPNDIKQKGFGSLLVQECVIEAEARGLNGIAAIASDGPFMADKRVFIKNRFKTVQESGNHALLVRPLKKAPLPKFKDWEKQLSRYKGLNVVYSNQCPWVARFICEIDEILAKKQIELKITELKTAKQAQNAPSIYAVFNLIYNGKLLADHYISKTRFLNIMNKDLSSRFRSQRKSGG
jgi:hypothetical protein